MTDGNNSEKGTRKIDLITIPRGERRVVGVVSRHCRRTPTADVNCKMEGSFTERERVRVACKLTFLVTRTCMPRATATRYRLLSRLAVRARAGVRCFVRERVAYVPLGKSRTRSGRELGIRAIRFLKHSDGSGRSPESRLSLARVPLLPLPHSTPWKLNRAKGT